MTSHGRKRKSDQIEDAESQANPRLATPTGSPAKKKLKITQAQKQALIDNLQLEITERARKLRANYALQATDVRSRIERRINRIPVSLRKTTMGELMERNLLPVTKPSGSTLSKSPKARSIAKSKNAPLPPLPLEATKHSSSPARRTPRGGGKRGSEIAIYEASDKENDQASSAMKPLPNPKNPKRTKAATAGTRTASRTVKNNNTNNHPSNVLSPKSHNSRTLPRSPIKDSNLPPASPTKQASFIGRPTSPLKPASPLKSAASAATSAISASLAGMVEHAKRGTANTVAKARSASKDKATGNTTTTTTAAAAAAQRKKQATMAMPPPPSRPPFDRAVSQASNHSTSSTSSNTTNVTTVITKKPATSTRSGKTTISSTTSTTRKAPTATTSKTSSTAAKAASAASAAATSRTGTTRGVTKKVVVAEPAAGRRVLRKRN